jgi:hypothetical protein
MEDHGQPEFVGRRHLGFKPGLLDFGRGVHAVKVKTDFPPGTHTLILGEIFQDLNHIGCATLGIVGMDAHGSVNIAVLPGYPNRLLGCVNGYPCNHNRLNSGIMGPFKHGAKIVFKASVVYMAMAVKEPHGLTPHTK